VDLHSIRVFSPQGAARSRVEVVKYPVTHRLGGTLAGGTPWRHHHDQQDFSLVVREVHIHETIAVSNGKAAAVRSGTDGRLRRGGECGQCAKNDCGDLYSHDRGGLLFLLALMECCQAEGPPLTVAI
jgi:hypothetical protein